MEVLKVHAAMRNDAAAQRVLLHLPKDILPPAGIETLRAGYFRKAGQPDKARTAARDALAFLAVSDDRITRRNVARELTIMKLYPEAYSLWKDIAVPDYVGLDIQMAIDSAVHSDEAAFVMTFCGELRANGYFDPACVSAELDTLNKYNCVETVASVLDQCLQKTDDETHRKNLLVQRSLLGLELDRAKWICTDPDQLPDAKTVAPGIGRSVAQILTASREPFRGVQYAYQLLRCHYASRDANMAMIVSVLMGKRHRLVIPEIEIAEPGAAVAIEEDGKLRWWVIEEFSKPNRALREIAPEHPLAVKLLGKRAGDEVTLREGGLQARVAKVLEVKSKYVYRFQECMSEFEEYFLDEPFLIQFTTKRADSDEPDLEPLRRSVTERAEAVREKEKAYQRHLPSVHCFAKATQTHVIESITHLATEQIPIRCCRGPNEELNACLTALRDVRELVIDESALATMFLCGAHHTLKRFPIKLTVSYGTLRGFKRLCLERLAGDGGGVFAKVGERFVFHKTDAQERARVSDEMEDFIALLESIATIEEGRRLSEIPRAQRDTLRNVFGAACAESIALAMHSARILWVDDLPVSLLASSEHQVQCAWTQAVVCHAYESGWIDGVLPASLKDSSPHPAAVGDRGRGVDARLPSDVAGVCRTSRGLWRR